MSARALSLVILGFVVGAAAILLADPGDSGSSASEAAASVTPGGAGGHVHAGVGDATLTGDTPCERANAAGGEGASGNAGREHGHLGFFKWTAMDRSTRDVLTQQLAVAHQVTLEYPTVASAVAAGYHMTTTYVPCIGAHYINTKYLYSFDPSRPAMLLYDGTNPDSKIVGLSYARALREDDPRGLRRPERPLAPAQPQRRAVHQGRGRGRCGERVGRRMPGPRWPEGSARLALDDARVGRRRMAVVVGHLQRRSPRPRREPSATSTRHRARSPRSAAQPRCAVVSKALAVFGLAVLWVSCWFRRDANERNATAQPRPSESRPRARSACRHRCGIAGSSTVAATSTSSTSGLGVLTVPVGEAALLLDEILPADAHQTAVAATTIRTSPPRDDASSTTDLLGTGWPVETDVLVDAIGGEDVATTTLWYAHGSASSAAAATGRSPPPGLERRRTPRAHRGARRVLPDDVIVIAMRQLARRMGELSAEHHGLPRSGLKPLPRRSSWTLASSYPRATHAGSAISCDARRALLRPSSSIPTIDVQARRRGHAVRGATPPQVSG